MPSSSLLIDSTEFRSAIEPAILRARRRVLIQVMTFEMDSIGKHFWDVFTRSPAKEKILCVDAFSTAKISDNLVFGGRYLTDSAFRQEVQETRQLLRYGKRDGVRIVVTNPMGTFLQKFPFRNHKKMMIVDDRSSTPPAATPPRSPSALALIASTWRWPGACSGATGRCRRRRE